MNRDSTSLNLRMQEVEFIAEEEKVDIIPNFGMGSLDFIGGKIGPFAPQRRIEVPLWLAQVLKKRQKCQIIPPEWLNVEFLNEKKEEERRSEGFTSLPSDHFQELAAILFECASDNIVDAENVRSLLADIYDLRYAKVRNGLKQATDSAAMVVDNLTMIEISAVRPIFIQSMNTFLKLDDAYIQATEE